MFYRKCLIPRPSSRMEVGPNILPDKGKGWRLCLTSGNIFVVQTLDTQRSEAADHVKVGILILQLTTQLQKKFFCNLLKLKSSMKENFFVPVRKNAVTFLCFARGDHQLPSFFYDDLFSHVPFRRRRDARYFLPPNKNMLAVSLQTISD